MKKVFQYCLPAALLLLALKPAVHAQGSLAGSLAASADTSVNLTAEGVADWSQWGYNNFTQQHKSVGGVPVGLISDETIVSSSYNGAYGDNRVTFSWSDGTPTAAVGGTITGLYAGDGVFQFTAPADTTSRILKVYVGGVSASATLTATLSDGSAATYTNSDPSSGNPTYAPDNNHFYAVYTFTYKAASAGQNLTIQWAQTGGGGNITLQAATLRLVPTAPPAAPTALTAVAGSARVGLTWNASPGADSYKIKRNTTGTGAFTTIGTSTSSSFQDVTAANGTTYYYEVTAVSTGGESAPSNIVSAAPQATLDGTGLTGNYWSDAAANVGYGPNFNYANAPAPGLTEIDPVINFANSNQPIAYSPISFPNPFGAGVNDFNVQWTGLLKAQTTGAYTISTNSDDGSRVYLDGNLIVSNYNYQGATQVNSAPVTLTAGSLHLITVQYFQGGGDAAMQLLWAYPNQTTQIIPAYALFPSAANIPPPAPTLAGSGFNQSAILSWTTISNATSYTLYRSTTSGSGYVAVPGAVGITGTTFIDTGLTLGTTYYYVVTATNPNGTSPNSNQVAVTPALAAPLIATEEFSYPVGSLDGSNGGTGWADPWSNSNGDVVTTPGLTFNSLVAADNTMTTPGAAPNGSATFRTISVREGSLHGVNTVFLSYLARLNPANNGTLGNNVYAGLSLYDGNTENFFTGIRYNQSQWGMESSQGGGNANTTYTPDNTIHFFVFKFDFTTTGVTVSEFVDPIPGGSLPAAPDGTATANGFNFDRIRIANGNSNDALQVDFDEIRFGRTYAVVSPVAGAAVTGRIALEGVTDQSLIPAAVAKPVVTVEFRTPGTTTIIKTANVTLTPAGGSAFGTYSVSGVANGTYDVAFKTANSLRVVLPNVAVTGSLALTDVTLPGGDAANDNLVDIGDFGLLVNAYSGDITIPGSGYDAAADFNFDGIVDIGDFGILVNEYSNSGAP